MGERTSIGYLCRSSHVVVTAYVPPLLTDMRAGGNPRQSLIGKTFRRVNAETSERVGGGDVLMSCMAAIV